MENFFTIPWFRLFLLLFFVYLIIAVLMWFFGDRLVFPAPRPSTYSNDQVSFTVPVKNKASIACLHLGERQINLSELLSTVMGTAKI